MDKIKVSRKKHQLKFNLFLILLTGNKWSELKKIIIINISWTKNNYYEMFKSLTKLIKLTSVTVDALAQESRCIQFCQHKHFLLTKVASCSKDNVFVLL